MPGVDQTLKLLVRRSARALHTSVHPAVTEASTPVRPASRPSLHPIPSHPIPLHPIPPHPIAPSHASDVCGCLCVLVSSCPRVLCCVALRVSLSPSAVLPRRSSAGAAGYDLSASAAVVVPSRGRALVPTDLSVAVPPGTYGRIAPRSGLALKAGIDVGAGVVDADYRGPLGVILFNHSDRDFSVASGDRVAQLILERIELPDVEEADELDSTERGHGAFGSTGVAAAVNKRAKVQAGQDSTEH